MEQILRREAVFQKINRVFMPVFTLIHIIWGFYFVWLGQPYYYILCFCAPLFLALPYGLFRLVHLRISHQVNLVIYLFVVLAYSIGLIAKAYSLVPYYDKVAHCLSGTFCTLLALLLFYLIKPNQRIERQDCTMATVFSLSVSIAVAGIWEMCEYAISLLFGNDPQNVLTTGVGDTMQDMLVCTLGSLFLVISILFYYCKGKTSFLMGAFEAFYQLNFGKDAKQEHQPAEKKK